MCFVCSLNYEFHKPEEAFRRWVRSHTANPDVSGGTSAHALHCIVYPAFGNNLRGTGVRTGPSLVGASSFRLFHEIDSGCWCHNQREVRIRRPRVECMWVVISRVDNKALRDVVSQGEKGEQLCGGSYGPPRPSDFPGLSRASTGPATLCFSNALVFFWWTAMLPSLPPELLDLIVDHSSDEPTTLNTCCLVSKSWVPRARSHLFAHVKFDSDERHGGSSVDLWMEAFPDPSNSPAHHTRTLTISGLPAVIAVTTIPGHAWVRSFRGIIKLAMNTHWYDDLEVSLVKLHGLSPILKSLCVDRSFIPFSEVFNLACSFPLLEDLSLCSFSSQQTQSHDLMDPPQTSPKLTGILQLAGDVLPIILRLLGLPGGLHFSKISTECGTKSLQLVVTLVSRCSETLEFLYLNCYSPGAFLPAFVIDRY
jgi:hypothetical protein